MYRLHKRGVISCLLMVTVMVCWSGQLQAHPQVEKNLRSGFALAQACEPEIDDDMAFYGECIGHAMDRVAGQRRVLLGVHFQAWLMADLAARQNSTLALALRKKYAKGLAKQLRATGLTLSHLCQAKHMSCEAVRMRMAQQFE